MTYPFADLPQGNADLIVADPPWSFKLRSAKGEAKSAQAQYSCMTMDDIAALPVADLAAPDCMLMLWATNPMLPDQIAVACVWGFEFVTLATWAKLTANHALAFGTGFVLRSASEHIIIAKRGQPKTTRSCRSIFYGFAREHSRKPDEFYDWAEQLMPHVKCRIDLFSRQRRSGWISWGDEVEKFGRVA